MITTIPNVSKELEILNWRELRQDKHGSNLNQLGGLLNKIGGFTLKSSLLDVMNQGNERTIDYETNTQSSRYRIELNKIDTTVNTIGDPLRYIEAEIDKIQSEYIIEITDDYIRGTLPISKPFNKWEPKAVAFFCDQQMPITYLEDVIYFIITFEGEVQTTLSIEMIQNCLHDFAWGVAKSQLLNYLKNLRPNYAEIDFVQPFDIIDNGKNIAKVVGKQINKMKWNGKPAHLALIVDLLIEKHYIAPQTYGERTAQILLEIFEFNDHTPSKESLGKLLHKDRHPISDKTAIDKFYRIPDRSELD